MAAEWTEFFAAALLLLAVVAVVEGLHARFGLPAEWGRRFVHVLVGLLAAVSPLVFESAAPVMWLSALFVPFNFVAIRRRWLRGMHDVPRRSDGTATFPLALLVAAWWCWDVDPSRIPALQAAFVVLAIADPLAAWVGGRWGASSVYRLGTDPKTRVGSAFFFVAAISAIGLVVESTGYLEGTDTATRWAIIGMTAGLATLAEAMGRSGWDNFLIVVAVTISLSLAAPAAIGLDRLAPAAALGLVVALGTRRAGLLDAGGAAAAGVLAFSIIWIAGWGWLWPGATFFLLSSGLSRIGRVQKDRLAVRPEKTGPRDAAQVFANGGVAWLALVLPALVPGLEPDTSLALYSGAFAAAAADTWSTEIGSLSRRAPRLVTTGRIVAAGTSGGVTPIGLAASMAGSASVASVVWLAGGPFVAVLAAGFLGSLVDSFAGAIWQGRWAKAAETGDRRRNELRGAKAAGAALVSADSGAAAPLTETPRPEIRPVRGYAWVTNDVVNLICTAAGAILAAMIQAAF